MSDEEKTIENLDNIILTQTNNTVQFYPDGGDGGARLDQEISLRLEYLTYYHSNVYYLPKITPEEIIWSDVMLEKLDSEEIKEQIRTETNYKHKFRLFAESLFGDASAETIQTVHKMFLTKFIDLNPVEFLIVKDTIQAILDNNPFIFD